jgi:hypothetical protein
MDARRENTDVRCVRFHPLVRFLCTRLKIVYRDKRTSLLLRGCLDEKSFVTLTPEVVTIAVVVVAAAVVVQLRANRSSTFGCLSHRPLPAYRQCYQSQNGHKSLPVLAA